MIERASEFGASAAMPLVSPETPEQATAGQMLRQAREAHGLHIDVVAAALKVPTQKLAALEADDIDALPDPVFARALAASVCRALRVDPAPVLEKLPGAPRAVLAESDRRMSGHIRSQAVRSSSARASVTGRPSRPLLAVVGLLLVGALVLFLLPQSATQQISEAWSRMTGATSEPAAGAARDGDGMVVEAPQTAAPAMPLTASTALTQPAPAATATPATPAPAAAPASATPPAAAAGADVLAFVARGESWIRVAGAGNRTVLERTLKSGESATVPQADLPLSVTVGRASVVDVQVQGKPFDLAPITRSGGVARFEVKP